MKLEIKEKMNSFLKTNNCLGRFCNGPHVSSHLKIEIKSVS